MIVNKMPFDAAGGSPHRVDIQTVPEIAAAYIQEAKHIASQETQRTCIDVAIRQAWARQAERFWIIKNVHGASVSAFAKSVDVPRTTGFDLVLYHEHRVAIHKHLRKAQAVAFKAGEAYHWPGWLRSLQEHRGRKPRPGKHDVGKTASKALAGTLIVDELRKQIVNLRAELASPARSAPPPPPSGRYGVPMRNGTGERPTPRYIVRALNEEHNFDLDPCADADNAVTERHFNKAQNGLKQQWKCKCAWLNPPYAEIEAWLKKAFEELKAGRCQKVVALLPAWTDTPWFAEYASHGQISFLIGRLKFGGASGTAFFPSMIVVLTDISVRRGRKLSAEILTIPKPQSQPAERLKTLS